MSEYTPTTDELRDLWVDAKLDHLPRPEGIELVPVVQGEFDRWLAEVRAQVVTITDDMVERAVLAFWVLAYPGAERADHPIAWAEHSTWMRAALQAALNPQETS